MPSLCRKLPNIANVNHKTYGLVNSIYGIYDARLESARIGDWQQSHQRPVNVPKCSYRDDVFHISGDGCFLDFGFWLMCIRAIGIAIPFMEAQCEYDQRMSPNHLVWKLLPYGNLQEIFLDEYVKVEHAFKSSTHEGVNQPISSKFAMLDRGVRSMWAKR